MDYMLCFVADVGEARLHPTLYNLGAVLSILVSKFVLDSIRWFSQNIEVKQSNSADTKHLLSSTS